MVSCQPAPGSLKMLRQLPWVAVSFTSLCREQGKVGKLQIESKHFQAGRNAVFRESHLHDLRDGKSWMAASFWKESWFLPSPPYPIYI